MADGKILILTGGRGAGKTALCQRLAFQARKAGWDTAGVFSPAILEKGAKTGIGIKDPRSGEQRLLALRLPPEKIIPGGLGWDFDPAALAWGNELLAHACPCDLLVVDELGPLELVRGEGWQAGIAALDSRKYRLGSGVHPPGVIGYGTAIVAGGGSGGSAAVWRCAGAYPAAGGALSARPDRR